MAFFKVPGFSWVRELESVIKVERRLQCGDRSTRSSGACLGQSFTRKIRTGSGVINSLTSQALCNTGIRGAKPVLSAVSKALNRGEFRV